MTYDFIVVGAGISGAASAYHLRETGANVLLIERGEPASGGTGKSAAIIRQSYSTPLLVRLAHASITMLARAKDELGQDAGLVQSGYCFLIASDMLDGARRNVAMQKALGIVNEWCDGAGFGQHLPDLNPDGIAAIVYEPHGGYADPVRATEAYVAAFRRLGGELQSRTPVRRLVRRGDRVAGVELDTGTISASFVVNAAGPWAARIGALLGVDVPVVPLRNQIGIWRLERPLDRMMPMVMDYILHSGARGLYVATYDDANHVLAGLHSEEVVGQGVDPDAYDQSADDDYLADTRAALQRRMPELPLGQVERAWAGLYPVSPDGLPIVGPTPRDDSVILAVGGGGSGIQLSPIMGALAADWIAYGEPRSLSDGELVAAGRGSVAKTARPS